MSSDRQLLQPAAPPSYTESQKHVHEDSTKSSGVNAPEPQPPPYSPNPGPSIVVETSGPGYQRFDVIEGQPHVVSIFHLGPDPCLVVCPSCGKQVMTVVHPTPGTLTWLMACLCFFFCMICTFLPFCVRELQDIAHECPLCRRQLGVFSRI